MWLSIDEAAAYLGIGERNLYALAQDARIPAGKVGKSWRFDQDQLDAWVRANRPLEEFFGSQQTDIEGNLRLRDAQREAYAAARDFFASGGKEAVIQLPVGCGKSGLVAILPFGIAKGRALVIAPNLTIKAELSQVLDIANRQKCFYRKCGILTPETMTAGPFLAVLDEHANPHDCDRSHIVLTNVQQLNASIDGWLSKFDDDYFALIVVDEGHHSAADSWQKVLKKFGSAKIVHLTATPFRTDRKEVPGTPVYRYSFKRAMLRGYIKQLQAVYVAPDEIYFTYRGDTHHHTLDEVLHLKEEAWFSRGVAASPECNSHIVDASLERLEHLRQSGTRHQLIAVAMSVDHARDIRSLYAERGYEAAVIHSKMSDDDQGTVIQQLRSGLLDCIIQVQMLGEGFDHPHLSVAAIFRPFRSLAPYIQFVGRIMRVIAQNDSHHPDNYGFIISHVGMNVDSLLEDFRKLDREDQEFLQQLLAGMEPEPPREVLEGNARLRFRPEMVVQNEIVKSFLEEEFIDSEDEALLTELLRQAEALGFDAEAVQSAARRACEGRRVVAAAEPFSVSPQRQRREAQRRLNEKVKHVAKIVLNRTQLQFAGRELSFRFFPRAVMGPNFAAAVQILNNELDKALGIAAGQRGKVPVETLTKGLEILPEIAERVARRIFAARGDQ